MNYPIFLNIFSTVDDLTSCSVKGGEGAFEEVKGGDKQVSIEQSTLWGEGLNLNDAEKLLWMQAKLFDFS